MIRTAILSVLALGALAAPALAFEHTTAAAPSSAASEAGAHFTNTRMFAGLMPGTASETLHFGQPVQDKPTVIYELHPDGKARRLDLTDPRDNPFMAQPERSAEKAPAPSADAGR